MKRCHLSLCFVSAQCFEGRRTKNEGRMMQWRDTCDYNWFFLNDFQFVLNSFSINHKRGSNTFVWRKKAAVTAKVLNRLETVFFFFCWCHSPSDICHLRNVRLTIWHFRKNIILIENNEIGRFCLSTSSCIVLVLWLWLCDHWTAQKVWKYRRHLV